MNIMADSGSTALPSFIRVLLVMLLVLCIGLVGFGAWILWQAGHAPPTPPGTLLGSDVVTKVEGLQTRLDHIEKHAEELQALISILLGVATLYSVALGVGSYLGMQHAVREAERSVGEIDDMRKELTAKLTRISDDAKKNATEVVHDIRQQFPVFGYMDVSIRNIMTELRALLPVADWTEDYHGKLSSRSRQRILSYEKTIAAFDFFDLRHYRVEASQIYHGLANFYGLSYATQLRKWKGKAGGIEKERDAKMEDERGIKDDLERCLFYFDRALAENNQNVAALNDRAFIAMAVESPSDRVTARWALEKSLQADAKQQRARYNLALLEHWEGNYEGSEKLLSEALLLERWQEGPHEGRLVSLRYNRACSRVKLAEKQPSSARELLQGALVDLRDAFRKRDVWDESLPEAIKQDTQSEGDLHLLATTEPYSEDLKQLLQEL